MTSNMEFIEEKVLRTNRANDEKQKVNSNKAVRWVFVFLFPFCCCCWRKARNRNLTNTAHLSMILKCIFIKYFQFWKLNFQPKASTMYSGQSQFSSSTTILQPLRKANDSIDAVTPVQLNLEIHFTYYIVSYPTSVDLSDKNASVRDATAHFFRDSIEHF